MWQKPVTPSYPTVQYGVGAGRGGKIEHKVFTGIFLKNVSWIFFKKKCNRHFDSLNQTSVSHLNTGEIFILKNWTWTLWSSFFTKRAEKLEIDGSSNFHSSRFFYFFLYRWPNSVIYTGICPGGGGGLTFLFFQGGGLTFALSEA